MWKFSSDVVAVIPSLYEEYGWGPLARVLPRRSSSCGCCGIRLWQWIGLGLLGGVAWGVSWLVRGVLVRVAKLVLVRSVQTVPATRIVEPLRLLLAVAVCALGLPLLGLAVPVHRVLGGVLKSLAIVSLTWLFLRILDEYAQRFERRLDQHARDTAHLGRRTLKVFIVIVAFIAALQNFGFNVTGLIAGLGVGGLAVALAAQKTVENLFGEHQPGRRSARPARRRLPLRRHGRHGRGHRPPLHAHPHRHPDAGDHPERAVLRPWRSRT